MQTNAVAQTLSMRPLVLNDLPHVLPIEKRIYPFPWSESNFRDSLKSRYDAWILFDSKAPAVSERSIIGYCLQMWAIDEVHILNLSVDRPFQRQGWGMRMLQWIGQDSFFRGARALLLEVRPTNSSAIALYERAGFVELGRRKNYYPSFAGGKEDAIVMQATLPLRQSVPQPAYQPAYEQKVIPIDDASGVIRP